MENNDKKVNEDSIWRGIYWRKKFNTLQGKYDVLEQEVKDGVFEQIIDKTKMETDNKRLKRENKNLREKVKNLKEIIKEGKI